MKYTKSKLKNGLKVIVAPMRDTQTVTVLVAIGIGSRYETKRENGLAHFLEHMFFKGTKRRPTNFDIAKELDGMGADYNAFTSQEYTGYYVRSAAKEWKRALDIVSDIFLNSKLEEEEVNKERGAVLQEINMYEDRPARRVHEYFTKLLYGDTPLGREILGPKENIKRFSRNDVVRFFKQNYIAEDAIVGVAGNIDPVLVKREIAQYFRTMPKGRKPELKKMAERQNKPGLFMQEKKTDQTHLVVGVRAFPRGHRDEYVLSLIQGILGNGMSSRLFSEVRVRRGLAYNVHTGSDEFQDVGNLSTYCGVEHDNLEEALRVIVMEYKKIATEPVSEEELRRAKDSMRGSVAIGLEGSHNIVEYLIFGELLRKKIILPQEVLRKVEKVTREDILRVAQDIFRSRNLNAAIIGPNVDQKRIENILTLLD